jgi:putative flavoprotein involved in K+ transport
MDFTKHENVVDEWLAAFAAALDQRNIDRVLDLFEPKAFWRDLATFTWNIYTAEGRDAIRAMLTNCLDATAATAWRWPDVPQFCGCAVDGAGRS